MKTTAIFLALSFGFVGQTSTAQSNSEPAPDTSCKAEKPLAADAITPVGIDRYLKENQGKIKDVGDLVCCLPESYKKRVAVVHSSASAQTSHHKGPRVLIYGCHPDIDPTCTKRESDLQSVLSINGGDEGLSQRHNVEAVFNNRGFKVLNMRDFEIKDGSHSMSENNPETCMACHGAGGVDSAEGPKPIMDGDDRWTRMSSGIFSDCWFSGVEAGYLSQMQGDSERALKKNPRYRCLAPGNTRDNVETLDRKLADLNEIRAARIQKSTPNYNSFKFALMGNALGCKDINAMIPDKAIEKMATENLTLMSSIAKATDLNAECNSQAKKMVADNNEINKFQTKALEKMAKGEIVEFRVQKGPFCGGGLVDASDAQEKCKEFKTEYNDPRLELFHRYKLDTMMVSNSNLTKEPVIWQRILNESRGVEEAQFQMQVRGGEFSARAPGVMFAGELMAKDPDFAFVSSDLVARNMMKNGVPGAKRFVGTEPFASSEKICSVLAQKSKEALGKWADGKADGAKSTGQDAGKVLSK